jgi:hypothetical protein
MATVKVEDLELIGDDVLVTFSDGRITTVPAADLYEKSKEAPPEPRALFEE